jgi:hypothetical protein
MFVNLDSLVLRGGAAAAGGLIYSERITLIISNSRLLNSSSSCKVWQDEHVMGKYFRRLAATVHTLFAACTIRLRSHPNSVNPDR